MGRGIFPGRPGTGGDKDYNAERGRRGLIVGDGRTDERLGDQPANGARKPYQGRELF